MFILILIVRKGVENMGSLLQSIINRDVQLFYLINRKIKCGLLDWFMPKITHLGGALFTITFTLLFVLSGQERFREIGWQALIALLTSGVVVQIVKHIVSRTRPYLALEEVNFKKPPFGEHSFPSGHTTAAFSLAIVCGANFPSLHPFSQAVAGLVGISRAYIGVHYPSDIIIGALIGIYFSNWALILL